MATKTGTKLNKAQQRYKRYFDNKVPFTPTFHVGQAVFVNRPPAYALTQSERLAGEEKSKLLPKAVGPFGVIAANRDTVTIDENGILNMISIDRATAVPGGESVRRGQEDEDVQNEDVKNDKDIENDEDENAETNYVAENDASASESEVQRSQQDAIPTGPEKAALDSQAPKEYVVERIVGHRKTRKRYHYRVRWYGYTVKDDTIEPPKHIPQHFIARYWERRKRTTTR